MNIQSHLLLMSLFACAVSVVGGTLLKDDLRQQARAGAAIFGTLVGGAILAGWILYFFPL
jgi:cyanophycinase-like exopeptidase